MTDPYSKQESLFPAQGILPFTAEVVVSRQAKVAKVFQDRFWDSPLVFLEYQAMPTNQYDCSNLK